MRCHDRSDPVQQCSSSRDEDTNFPFPSSTSRSTVERNEDQDFEPTIVTRHDELVSSSRSRVEARESLLVSSMIPGILFRSYSLILSFFLLLSRGEVVLGKQPFPIVDDFVSLCLVQGLRNPGVILVHRVMLLGCNLRRKLVHLILTRWTWRVQT